MLDGGRAWGVPAVGTSWWMGRGLVYRKGLLHSLGAAWAKSFTADQNFLSPCSSAFSESLNF